MKIALIEDEEIYSSYFKNLINQYESNNSLFIELDIFNTSITFLEKFKANYDIIFIDIELPDINGLELSKKIRKIDEEAIIIFITNLAQFAINGYEVNAYDYIVKPIKYERLEAILNKISTKVEKNADFFNIKTTSGYLKIRCKDVYYISVDDHLVYLHLKNKNYECWDSLKNIEKTLPKDFFVRISKSKIVNIFHIASIGNKTIILSNDLELTFSPLLKNQIMDALNKVI